MSNVLLALLHVAVTTAKLCRAVSPGISHDFARLVILLWRQLGRPSEPGGARSLLEPPSEERDERRFDRYENPCSRKAPCTPLLLIFDDPTPQACDRQLFATIFGLA
jgi:hypothetical protein